MSQQTVRRREYQQDTYSINILSSTAFLVKSKCRFSLTQLHTGTLSSYMKQWHEQLNRINNIVQEDQECRKNL